MSSPADAQESTVKALSDKQLSMLEAAQEIGFGRNISTICEDADVSRTCFYKWMREDRQFITAWEELPMKMVNKHLPGIIVAQVHAANLGDTKAARLMLDYAGLLKQKHEHSGPGGGPIKHAHDMITQPDRQRKILDVLNRAGVLDSRQMPADWGNGSDNGDGNGS